MTFAGSKSLPKFEKTLQLIVSLENIVARPLHILAQFWRADYNPHVNTGYSPWNRKGNSIVSFINI